MTLSLKREDWLILLGLLGTTVAVLLCYGCILDPGAQVRQGLSQQKTYEWTDEGTIRVHGIGPQEEAFLMMEGAIVMTDAGEVDWGASKITHYLRSEPSADEAMATMGAILLSNQKQAEAFYESVGRTLGTVTAMLKLALPYFKPPSDPEPEPGPLPTPTPP